MKSQHTGKKVKARGSRVRGHPGLHEDSVSETKDGAAEMAWWIRTLAICKFEDPNSDPSTHANKIKLGIMVDLVIPALGRVRQKIAITC